MRQEILDAGTFLSEDARTIGSSFAKNAGYHHKGHVKGYLLFSLSKLELCPRVSTYLIIFVLPRGRTMSGVLLYNCGTSDEAATRTVKKFEKLGVHVLQAAATSHESRCFQEEGATGRPRHLTSTENLIFATRRATARALPNYTTKNTSIKNVKQECRMTIGYTATMIAPD